MTAERFTARYSPRPPTQSEIQIRRMTASSWETTGDMLDVRTKKHPQLHAILENEQYRGILKGYYEAVLKDFVLGNGTTNCDIYLNGLSDSQDISDVSILKTHFKIIRETVTHTIERPSRGWARRIRKEKAESKT